MPQAIAFVTGATGHQGGAAACELLKSGIRVHALVRNPSSESAVELQRLGAQLFPGDFDNISALKAAMEGATAVFLNVSPTPSDPDREVIHAKNIIEIATASGSTVTTIVYSSVTMTGKHETFPNWGPDYPAAWYWQSKARIESLVQESNVKYWTILRPAFPMSNYHQPMASHLFPDLVQRRATFGKFVAAAVVDPVAFNRHKIDLGAEALTPAEIVNELNRVSGSNIAFQFYSDEEAAVLARKTPIIGSHLWTNDVGYQVDFTALSKYPIRLTTFREYLEKHRDKVVQTLI